MVYKLKLKSLFQKILEAEDRIRPYICDTPFQYAPGLSNKAGCNLYLKLENLQVTGSFKARGAINKVIKLKEQRSGAEFITASTGNHALGVANAINIVGGKGRIFLPSGASASKLQKLYSFNVPVSMYGNTCEETESYARSLCSDKKEYISPYNDMDVIAGQGTIGIELYRQEPLLDAVFVSVGGGGLISGVASYLKTVNPRIKIIGCLPENAPAMLECIKAGKIISVHETKTISDGTAGGIEEGAITFEFCKKLVDEFITVSEAEIFNAMQLVYKFHEHIIEGAAGVALAGLLKNKDDWKDKKVAVILCGGNISETIFEEIMNANV